MARKIIDRALFNRYCEMYGTDVISKNTGEIIASIFDYDLIDKVTTFTKLMDAPYYEIIKRVETPDKEFNFNLPHEWVFRIKNVYNEKEYFLGNANESIEKVVSRISNVMACLGMYYTECNNDTKVTRAFTNEMSRYLLDLAFDIKERGIVGGFDYNTNETITY